MRAKPHPLPAANPLPLRRFSSPSGAPPPPNPPLRLQIHPLQARMASPARGSRIGRFGGRAATTCTLTAEEELERRRRVSDAARMRGAYRYLRPSPAFVRRESRYWRARSTDLARAFTESSSRSTSAGPCTPPCSPLALLASAFAEADYVDDDDLDRVLAQLPPPVFAEADFIADHNLETVERLVMDTSRREQDKTE